MDYINADFLVEPEWVFEHKGNTDLVIVDCPWEYYSYTRAHIPGARCRPGADDITIYKRTPDSFFNTKLLEIIKELSIKNIYIAGNQSDYCIDTTCKSAFSKGLRVVLAKDCHSTWDLGTLTAIEIIEHHNNILKDWFVILKDSNEINFNEFSQN